MRKEEQEQQKIEKDSQYESRSRFLFRNGGLYRNEKVSGEEFSPGFYRFVELREGIAIHRFYIPEQDQYIDRSTEASAIQEDMLRFFRNKEYYRNMNMAFRRGALVYGPPGTGKTYSIIRTAKTCIQEFDALVFLVNSRKSLLENIAPIGYEFRNRATIFIFEEIAGANGKGRIDARFLNFLDGELSWENNYNVATTNYAGELPGNIVDRPGRFDMLIRMDEPSRAERKQFLDAYLGPEAYDEEDLDRMEGFSVAYLKEMALRTKLYDQSLKDVLGQMEDQKQKIKQAFDVRDNRMGFLNSDGRGE